VADNLTVWLEMDAGRSHLGGHWFHDGLLCAFDKKV
jgi:hypothetical protein